MKIIILLAGMSRGGTDLFQSLLDKHVQISQLPGSFYVDEFLKKIKKTNKSDEIANQFIKDYEEYFNSKLNVKERHDSLGLSKSESYQVDKNEFRKQFVYFSKHTKLEKKNIIINLHLAYSSASGEDVKKKKIIILQIHHFFRINSILDLDFDIICSIRDPIASHSSYVKNLAAFNNKSIDPWQFYYHIERNLSHLIKLSKLNKNINVIKLERLHRNNVEVMKNFCRMYEINFQDSLTSSTFHGKLWWGDKVSKNYLSGINKNFENKIEYNAFYKRDIELFEYLLENYIKSYKYSFRSTSRRFLSIKKYFPFKVDKIIFLQSLKNLNLKNFVLGFYYYFKRFKLMKKNILDDFRYPPGL